MKPGSSIKLGLIASVLAEGKKRRHERRFSMNNRVDSNKGVRAVTHQVGVAVSVLYSWDNKLDSPDEEMPLISKQN